MQLEKLQYLVEWEEERIYDQEWNSIPGKPCEFLNEPYLFKMYQPNSVIQDAKLLEFYILGKLEWPMMAENHERACEWPRLPRADVLAGLTDKATGADREFLDGLEEDYEGSFFGDSEDDADW
jgi:hypothetical protein